MLATVYSFLLVMLGAGLWFCIYLFVDMNGPADNGKIVWREGFEPQSLFLKLALPIVAIGLFCNFVYVSWMLVDILI